MNNKAIYKILNHLGFQVEKVLTSQKGYRNLSFPIKLKDGQMINLIIYKNEKTILRKIQNADLVSNYLYKQGFPTRYRIIPKILKIKFKNFSGKETLRYIGIYNYLDGGTIPWEAYTKEHIKELGHQMSDMHFALDQSDIDKSNFENVISIMRNQLDQMQNYFNQENVIKALNDKLEIKWNQKNLNEYDDLINELEELKENSILHLDFVRGNILFNDEIITGILDFEKTALGPKIIDIARTLAFLIVDCKFKDEKKVRKYFLRSGYIKRGKSKLENVVYLNKLVEYFLLFDFYKFLLHNPYEDLNKNEHFIRTKKLLNIF